MHVATMIYLTDLPLRVVTQKESPVAVSYSEFSQKCGRVAQYHTEKSACMQALHVLHLGVIRRQIDLKLKLNFFKEHTHGSAHVHVTPLITVFSWGLKNSCLLCPRTFCKLLYGRMQIIPQCNNWRHIKRVQVKEAISKGNIGIV